MELISLLARATLLPAGITRIINGLVHLPADIMRAIAVLDAPAMAAMTADGGGDEADVTVTDSNLSATIFIDEKDIQNLTEEDIEQLRASAQNVSAEDQEKVGGIVSATARLIFGFSSGNETAQQIEGVERVAGGALSTIQSAAKKIPEGVNVTVVVQDLSAGRTFIAAGVAARDIGNILDDLARGEQPSAGEWIEAGASLGEFAVGVGELAAPAGSAASQALPYVSGGIKVVKGIGGIIDAWNGFKAGEISEDELFKILFEESMGAGVGVLSVIAPPIGLVYDVVDVTSKVTTGESLFGIVYLQNERSIEVMRNTGLVGELTGFTRDTTRSVIIEGFRRIDLMITLEKILFNLINPFSIFLAMEVINEGSYPYSSAPYTG